MTAILMCSYSVKGKHYYSQQQCLERSKISRNNHSSVLYLSMSVGRAPPTSTSCRSLNMSNKRPRWSICLNVCKRLPLPSSFSAITRTRSTIFRNTYFSKGSRLSPSMDQRVWFLFLCECVTLVTNGCLSPGGTTVCHQILQVRCQGRHGRFWRCVQGARF